MGREIKFRAWDSLEKRYVYPDSPNRHHHAMSLDGRFFNLQNGSGGDEYVLQQFTGLKDRNGKDIYEGDIVRLESSPESYAEVVWIEDPELVSSPQWGLWIIRPAKGHSLSIKGSLEVVGDIFNCSFERIMDFFSPSGKTPG